MPQWIRVRDVSTGHETDIDPRSMRYGFELVDDPERWPDLDGPGEVPRPAKYFVGKDGKAPAPKPSDDTSLTSSPDAQQAGTPTDQTPPADAPATKKGRS